MSMSMYPVSFSNARPTSSGTQAKISRDSLSVHLKSGIVNQYFAVPNDALCASTGSSLGSRALICQKKGIPYYIAVKLIVQEETGKPDVLDQFLNSVNLLFDVVSKQATRSEDQVFCSFYDVVACSDSQIHPKPPLGIFELLPNSTTFEPLHSKVYDLMMTSMFANTTEQFLNLAAGWFEEDSHAGTPTFARSELWLKKALDVAGPVAILEEVRKLKATNPKFVALAFKVLAKEATFNDPKKVFSTFSVEELVLWSGACFEKETGEKKFKYDETTRFLEKALKKAGESVSTDLAKRTGDKRTENLFTKAIRATGLEADWVKRVQLVEGEGALFGELFKLENDPDSIKFVVHAYTWLATTKAHANSHCRLADIYTKGRFKEGSNGVVVLIPETPAEAAWHLEKASQLGVAAATQRLAKLTMTVDEANPDGYDNIERKNEYSVPDAIVREQKAKAKQLLRVSVSQMKLQELAGQEYLLTPGSAAAAHPVRRNSTGSTISSPGTPRTSSKKDASS